MRKTAVAGMFYPGNREALKGSLQQFLAASEKTAQKPVKIIIVPHAGYSYSGTIAGAAFREVDPETIDHVILLGPSHRHYFRGMAESTEDLWETPLGTVEISHLNSPGIIRNATYHQKEHCLEVQFPFLKYLMPDVRVSPLLLSGDRSKAGEMAERLLAFDSRKTLWVISSDFSHSGPAFRYFPGEFGYTSGKSMDRDAIQLITAGDITGFSAFLQKTEATICGAIPILVAMHLLRMMNRDDFTLKAYDCSGDQTGDANSVGYGALFA